MGKKEAAFHEAGHAVLAHHSKFHKTIGGAELSQYGSGATAVSCSKERLEKHGAKYPSRETAEDLAPILLAGLAAEKIAAEGNAELKPDPTCALPDQTLLKQELGAAFLSKKFDRFEAEAGERLRQHWDQVEAVATALLGSKTGSLTEDELAALLQ